MVCGNTLQVRDYSVYDWTYFDPGEKRIRHDTVFPQERRKAFEAGKRIASKSDSEIV